MVPYGLNFVLKERNVKGRNKCCHIEGVYIHTCNVGVTIIACFRCLSPPSLKFQISRELLHQKRKREPDEDGGERERERKRKLLKYVAYLLKRQRK